MGRERPEETGVPRELLGFLRPYAPPIRQLALRVRDLVLREIAPSHENIYDAYSAVAMGYGTSDRLKDGICHVAVYAKHVNLGLNHGARLPDPHGVLKGSGNRIRHITITSIEDLERPAVRECLQAACALAGHTTRARRKSVVSTVKAIYPRKRRPA